MKQRKPAYSCAAEIACFSVDRQFDYRHETHLLPYLHDKVSAFYRIAQQYVYAKINFATGRISHSRYSCNGISAKLAYRTALGKTVTSLEK